MQVPIVGNTGSLSLIRWPFEKIGSTHKLRHKVRRQSSLYLPPAAEGRGPTAAFSRLLAICRIIVLATVHLFRASAP
jgi:hypothetical protein